MFKKFMFRSIIILLLPFPFRPAMITQQINIRMNILRLTLIDLTVACWLKVELLLGHQRQRSYS